MTADIQDDISQVTIEKIRGLFAHMVSNAPSRWRTSSNSGQTYLRPDNEHIQGYAWPWEHSDSETILSGKRVTGYSFPYQTMFFEVCSEFNLTLEQATALRKKFFTDWWRFMPKNIADGEVDGRKFQYSEIRNTKTNEVWCKIKEWPEFKLNNTRARRNNTLCDQVPELTSPIVGEVKQLESKQVTTTLLENLDNQVIEILGVKYRLTKVG